MTHIANQRIKKGGKHYAPGDPITLSKDDLKDLPEGAASPARDAPQDEPPAPLDDAQTAKLKAAVARLKPGAFKQDGAIRAGALKHLNESLGFAVSVADVASAKDAKE